MERQILHLNIANFMASIEELCSPSLRGEPFIIAPPGEGRTVVFDVSEKAFREGIRRGMPVDLVRRRMGHIPVIAPRYDRCARAERELFALTSRYSPLVEQVSGGHLFADITGMRRLFGNSVDLAARIKREIWQRMGVQPVTGLAVNRLVSKVATRVVKPDGFVYVLPGDERSFMGRQDIGLLPGIGKKLGERMDILGVREIGDLADLSDGNITAALGGRGIKLRDSARGIDFTPVAGASSHGGRIRVERILDRDVMDTGEMTACLFSLAEEAGMRLRQNNMAARSVEIGLMYTDGKNEGAAVRLPRHTFTDREIFDAARSLLLKSLRRRVRIRKLSLSLAGLLAGCIQLDLFVPPEAARAEALQKAVDAVRGRFGEKSLRVGITMMEDRDAR
ncbi:MAG: hypothetical protein CVV44_04985 [Spirochaetae bacterium HGW-Spirochaetae-1]|jgi:DNA polymerase-4|nr:MAG: hypothetical protein CVV44_04985 [Spirochaetae bacterium HGW-Spirochaetae-1]